MAWKVFKNLFIVTFIAGTISATFQHYVDTSLYPACVVQK